MATNKNGPRVFISYAHESDAFREQVKKLAEWLEAKGVTAISDRLHQDRPPELGWPLWMQHEIEAADVVLLVCSPKFKARFEKREVPGIGMGVTFEGAIVTQDLYDASMRNDRFFPILPDGGSHEDVPKILRPFHNNHRFPSGYDRILRLITSPCATAAPGGGPTPPCATAAPGGVPSRPATTTRTLHNLPFGRNKYFKGREEILDYLEKTLALGRSAALIQAVVGAGGVGKTAIALEFCHRYLDRYRLVWWIKAERSLATDFIALAEKLGIAVKGLDEDQVVAAVKNTLSASGDWLLVFDNAAGPEEVRKYLPTIPAGHVIITSRDQTWGHVTETVPVDVMAPDEAVDFLTYRAGRESPADRAEAADLAKALGYLPLALEQAGAYLADRKQGFRYYLDLFEKKRSRLFTLHKPLDYNDTVWTTYNVSILEAEDKTLAGAELIKLMAFLAPDDIPLEVVKLGVEFLPPKLADDIKDPIQFDQMVMVLSRYSLIKLEADLASIHRLLQDVVREKMSPDERKTWAQAAAKIVNRVFPSDLEDPKAWPRFELLLEHAQAAAGHAEIASVALSETARLLNQAGTYLHFMAAFSRAEPLMRRALAIDEVSFGPEHPKVAIRLNNLALLLHETNRLSEAETLMKRVVDIFERSLGETHPNVATALNNLAALRTATNHLSKAESLLRRALSIDEASFGPEHPKVAIRLNNLAQLLHATNRLSEAEPLMRRALKIDEAALVPT